MSTLQLRTAAREQAKIRLGFSSVSGGGKTVSALLVAYGMTGDWSKIAVIDTENKSADLYANHTLADGTIIGKFQVITLEAPYTPERYVQCIKMCEDAGIEVGILDSITHEWDGVGGCLEIVEEYTQRDAKKNSYTQWAKVTPRHQDFINAILKSPMHIFTTVRRKQDYSMDKDGNGKTVITKVGLKEIQREGFEYELTANIELDKMHNATSSKDRTGLFEGKPPFVPSIETGKLLKAWCESGEVVTRQPAPTAPAPAQPPVQQTPFNKKYTDATTIMAVVDTAKLLKEELYTLYGANKEMIDGNAAIQTKFKARELLIKNDFKVAITDTQFDTILGRIKAGEAKACEQAIKTCILSVKQLDVIQQLDQDVKSLDAAVMIKYVNEADLLNIIPRCFNEAQILKLHSTNALIIDRTPEIKTRLNAKLKEVKQAA